MLHFNFNGKTYKEGTAIIGADNRGLRYGDGLFETMKMINSKLVFADEHFARLWHGMNVLQFEIPKHFTPENIEQEILALAVKNDNSHAARIRLSVVRGDGGLYDAKNHTPLYFIQSWALPETSGIWNSNGLVLGIYDAAKKSCDILSDLKHNNYLPYVMAALEAKKQKWNDAVLINSYNRVCDTTIANIFLIKNGVVFTPPLSEGCVAGVIRKHLIRQLHIAGFELAEKEITIDELLNADEVFLTNSMYHIRWVHQINDSVFENAITQKIYSVINPTIL